MKLQARYSLLLLLLLLAIACTLLLKPATWRGAVGTLRIQEARASSEEEDLRELERIKAERERSIGQLQNFNPLGTGFDPLKALTPALTPAQQDQFSRLPIGQRVLRVLADPRFLKAASEIREHPNRMNFLYVEAGWFVLIFVLRMWRSAVLEHWARRLWMRVWTGLLLLLGSTLVIPGLMIGAVYYRVLGMLGMIFGIGGYG